MPTPRRNRAKGECVGSRLELENDRLVLPVPDVLRGCLVSGLEGFNHLVKRGHRSHSFPSEAGDDVSGLEVRSRRDGLWSDFADIDPFCPGRHLLRLLRMLGQILFGIRSQKSEGWSLRAGERF